MRCRSFAVDEKIHRRALSRIPYTNGQAVALAGAVKVAYGST
jgi:hypothetical protein